MRKDFAALLWFVAFAGALALPAQTTNPPAATNATIVATSLTPISTNITEGGVRGIGSSHLGESIGRFTAGAEPQKTVTYTYTVETSSATPTTTNAAATNTPAGKK